MIVADVMSAPAVTVEAETRAKEAMGLLDTHSLTALPVVSGGALVGVVSEADLIREALPADLTHHVRMLPDEDAQGAVGRTLVIDLMSHHPVSVRADTDLAEAAEMLTETMIKSLPVVDDSGAVVGVISRADIVRVLARPDSTIEAEVDDRLRSYGHWLVEVTDGVVTVDGPETEAQRALARASAYAVPGVRRVLLTS